MKSTKMPPKVQLDQLLDICVDVSKSKLNVYFELGDRAFDDGWPNTTRQIEKKLRSYRRLASEHGLKSLRVICEPSGGYPHPMSSTRELDAGGISSVSHSMSQRGFGPMLFSNTHFGL